MEFIMNGTKHTFTEQVRNLRYLGEGNEAEVYYYNNLILKIYKEYSYVERLSEETAAYLSKIPTSRFLLPKDLIYNTNQEFIGYSEQFVQSYSKENIKRLKLEFLKNELLLLINDIIELSKRHISIFDIENDNFLLGNGIYLVDPGKYRKEEYNPIKENLKYLKGFIISDILLVSRRLRIDDIKAINKNFSFDDLLNSQEKTISLYTKSLIR